MLREVTGGSWLSLSVCVCLCGRLQEVTGGYRRDVVPDGYGRLRVTAVTGGHGRLREVMVGYRWLRMVTGGCGRSRKVSGGYGG